MLSEKKSIFLIKNGIRESSVVILEEGDVCKLTIIFSDGSSINSTNDDYFSCLSDIRKKAPDVIFLCKGAKLNVFPSRMSRQMGRGRKAYENTLGRQSTFDNIVDIFEFEDSNIAKTPEEQERYFREWVGSLS